ncbi:MAG: cadherin domain-containing protein, partial [Acidobacteria bacterium]|nr:cadherin domain-containing protein [Acidobacteriota bacterium]
SALKVGETSTLTITFSEAVTAFANSDITLANGTLSTISSADSGVTWTGTFTPTDDIEDTSNAITGGTTLTDLAGNAPLVGKSTSNYTIDTKEPTVSSVVMSDSALTVAETSTLTIIFSEAVTAFANADITLANGTLSTISSADSGVTWTGTFTPTDDIEESSNVITVGTTLTDLAGNVPLAGDTTTNYSIDTIEPLVAITRDDANPTNADSVVFSVDFSEDVANVDAADFSLGLVGVTANTTVTVGDAGDADASTYTVTVDTLAGDGTLGLDIAGGNNITDTATNAVNTTPTTDAVYTIDNTAPAITASQSFSVSEDAADTTSVGTVAATGAGSLQAWTIAAGNGDGDGIFAINAATGAVTVANNTNLDHETTGTYVLTLSVGDGVNTSDTETITVNVTDVNEADPVVNNQGFAIAENSANGTSVGTLSASDADTSQTLTYAITAGNTNGALAINSSTGEITVNDVNELDHETSASYALTVQVTDSLAPTRSDSATVTINVTDVNESPTDLSLSQQEILENSAAGSTVGAVSAVDPDTGETFTYQLTDDAGGRFALDGDGILTVAQAASLDYEQATSHDISIRVTDAQGLTYDETFTIEILDEDEGGLLAGDSEPFAYWNPRADEDGPSAADESRQDTTQMTNQAPPETFFPLLIAINTEAPDVVAPQDISDVPAEPVEPTATETESAEPASKEPVSEVALADQGPVSERETDDAKDEDQTQGDETEVAMGDIEPTATEPTSPEPASEEPVSEVAVADQGPPSERETDDAKEEGQTQAEKTELARGDADGPTHAGGMPLLSDRGKPGLRNRDRTRGSVVSPPDAATIAAWEMDPLFQELETMVQSVEAKAAQQAKVRTIRVRTTAAIAGTISVTYVVWLAHSGALTASMTTSSAVWWLWDPSPTL